MMVMIIESGKESACDAGDAGDVGSTPGSGRSPGGGHGNPLQSSCWENPIDRGAQWAAVHGVTESDTAEATAWTNNTNMKFMSLLSTVLECGFHSCTETKREQESRPHSVYGI